jgi:hypothetical protein
VVFGGDGIAGNAGRVNGQAAISSPADTRHFARSVRLRLYRDDCGIDHDSNRPFLARGFVLRNSLGEMPTLCSGTYSVTTEILRKTGREFEIRRKLKIANSKPAEIPSRFAVFDHSRFELVSDFGIRVPSLVPAPPGWDCE